MWTQPCGRVSYAEAVALVVDWTQQHNNLLASLEIPDLALQVRRNTEVQSYAPMVAKMVDTITGLETDPNVVEISPNKSKVTYDLSGFDPLEAAIAGIKEADSNPSYDSEDKLVRYRAIQEASFGMHIDPPAEQDAREEFDLVKRKLERRIAGIAGDPDTISAVAQRYFKFAGIRSGVEGKYRRNISKLIDHISDLPVKHVTSKMLREFRDAQSDTMKASSLSSVFTPIRGLFSFAIEEDIIEINPMASVQLQKEKRSLDEIKWKRFSADEMQRIMAAMDTV